MSIPDTGHPLSRCVAPHHDKPVPAPRPHLCGGCRGALARRLRELPPLLALHRALVTGLGSAWSPGRERGSGERVLPGQRTLTVDGPAAPGVLTGAAPDEDQDDSDDPVWSTVAGLAGVVAGERRLVRPRTMNLTALVTWLLPHVEWLGDHEAADEHAGQVHEAWSGLRSSTGIDPARPRLLPAGALCPMCERGGHLALYPVTRLPMTDADGRVLTQPPRTPQERREQPDGVPLPWQPSIRLMCSVEPDEETGETGCGHEMAERHIPRWARWLEQLDREQRRDRLRADRRHRAEVEAAERRVRREERGVA